MKDNKLLYIGPDEKWKTKVNLYQMIQQLCDRPAFFWYGFRYIVIDSIPGEGGVYTIEELINLGRGYIILDHIKLGVLDPQEWCDNPILSQRLCR